MHLSRQKNVATTTPISDFFITIGGMEELQNLFGVSKSVEPWHVVFRTLVIVTSAFVFLRIAGRRSFGLRAPFDNLLAILMGAISSQGIVGNATVLNVLVAGLTVAVAHRLVALLEIYFPRVGLLLKGEKMVLYKDGALVKKNLVRSLVDEDDIMREFRLRACDDNLENIKTIYMETSGQISSIRKPSATK